jgi:large subunit ribosomal protein L19
MSDEDKKPEDEEVVKTAPEATPEVATEPAAPEAVVVEEPVTETTEAEVPAEEVVETDPALAYKAKLVGVTDVRPGMTIKLSERIKDISPKGEERERIQVFEGIVLAMGGKGITRTLTIRKVSKGFGVEKIYPINSPIVSKIELVKTAKVRRAKLNYLKDPKRRFKRKLKEVFVEMTGGKKKKKKR